MDCTPKRCCSLGESSTLTFTSLRRPAMSVATCASAGLTIRHGPHQGAHRSTTTGTDARSATSAKVSSPASTIQGSGLWQLAAARDPGGRGGHPVPASAVRAPDYLDLTCAGRLNSRRIVVRHGELAVRQADADDVHHRQW